MAGHDNCSDVQGVLNQFEDLFSAIALLPSEIRDATLKKIRSKLDCDAAPLIKIECSPEDPTTDRERLDEVEAAADGDVEISTSGSKEPEERCRPVRNCSSRYASAARKPIARSKKPPKKADDTNAKSKQKPVAAKRQRKTAKKSQSNGTKVKKVLSNEKDDVREEETTTKAGSRRSPRTKTKQIVNNNCHRDDDDDDDDELTNGDIPMRMFKVPSNFRQKDVNKLLPNGVIQSVDDDENKKRSTKTCYGCTQCNRNFLARTHLVIHMRTHTGERPHVCTKCGQRFTQRSALGIHMQAHDGVANHKCPHCTYRALRKIDMLRHIARTHSTERNFCCDLCSKSFTTDVAIKEHVRYVHVRSNRHMCHLCGYITHRADNLQRHLRVCHSTIEQHECPVCGRLVNQRGTFLAHLRTHTGERPHACSKCDKAFKSHSQLASHLLTHGAGTFQCETCQRMFKTRFHLVRHSVVHTGEKPYGCPHCEYACNVPNNINKHVRSVHGILDYSWSKKRPKPAENGGNDEADATNEFAADRAKEKGRVAAAHFLEQLSLRKEEGLTVNDLRQKLEDERTQKKCVKPKLAKKKKTKKDKKRKKKKKKKEAERDSDGESDHVQTDDHVLPDPESEMASAVLNQEEEMDGDEVVHADVFIQVEEHQAEVEVDGSTDTLVFLIDCQDTIIDDNSQSC